MYIIRHKALYLENHRLWQSLIVVNEKEDEETLL